LHGTVNFYFGEEKALDTANGSGEFIKGKILFH
jgi:hypothetical protein